MAEINEATSLEERRAQLSQHNLYGKRLLAAGAFAEVYEVEEMKSPNGGKKATMAAKVYYELGWDDRILHAQKEYNTVKGLKHENICQAYELVVGDDIIFMTMEFLTTELFEMIEGGKGIILPHATNIIADVAAGLAFLHDEEGLAHLDIKAENVLLTADTRAKVADFDTALPLGTYMRRPRGTLECHPPEYVLDSVHGNSNAGFFASAAADIWAVGLIAYELLLGVYPWDSASLQDPAYRTFDSPPMRMQSPPWSSMPPGLVAFFEKVWSDNPAFRPSALELLGMVRAKAWSANAARLKASRGDAPGAAELDVASPDVGATAFGSNTAVFAPKFESPAKASGRSERLKRMALDPVLNPTSSWVAVVTPTKEKGHQIFTIVLARPREKSKAGRLVLEERYSRLLALHRMACGLIPENPPRGFPSKRFIWHRTSDFVLHRASKLADYFEAAMCDYEVFQFYAAQIETIVVESGYPGTEIKSSPTAVRDTEIFEAEQAAPAIASSRKPTSTVEHGSIETVVFQIAPLDLSLHKDLGLEVPPRGSIPLAVLGDAYNRYRNIVPSWSTRVVLGGAPPGPKASGKEIARSYINANHIGVLVPGGTAYIATQGPMASTAAAFWQMVWEQGTTVVVMLTKLFEGTAEKCWRYWPRGIGPGAAQIFGEVSVATVSVVTSPSGHTETTLSISCGGAARTVRHFWYDSWPDVGVPVTAENRVDPGPLLSLVLAVRAVEADLHESAPNASVPTAVHCSAGVGRTGTYILVESALSVLDRGEELDLLKLLKKLRRCRMGMVQRAAQYKLAWQACVVYARTHLARDRATTIQSVSSVGSVASDLRRDSLRSNGDWAFATGALLGDGYVLKKDSKAPKVTPQDNAESEPRVAVPGEHAASAAPFTEANVGERVMVSGIDSSGIIRFVGPHATYKTLRVGIELDAMIGKHNGTVGGHRYFVCNAGHGVLVKPSQVLAGGDINALADIKVQCGASGAIDVKPNGTQAKGQARSLREKRETIANLESKLHRRVAVKGYPGLGTLRFIGLHKTKASYRCGVELDSADGNNDGTVGGCSYFECPDKHGVLCAPSKVEVLPRPSPNDIGKRVQVRGTSKTDGALGFRTVWRPGTLAYYGNCGESKAWVGVILDEPTGNPKSNGRRNGIGKLYFECPAECGILCSRKKVAVIAQAGSVGTSPTSEHAAEGVAASRERMFTLSSLKQVKNRRRPGSIQCSSTAAADPNLHDREYSDGQEDILENISDLAPWEDASSPCVEGDLVGKDNADDYEVLKRMDGDSVDLPARDTITDKIDKIGVEHHGSSLNTSSSPKKGNLRPDSGVSWGTGTQDDGLAFAPLDMPENGKVQSAMNAATSVERAASDSVVTSVIYDPSSALEINGDSADSDEMVDGEDDSDASDDDGRDIGSFSREQFDTGNTATRKATDADSTNARSLSDRPANHGAIVYDATAPSAPTNREANGEKVEALYVDPAAISKKKEATLLDKDSRRWYSPGADRGAAQAAVLRAGNGAFLIRESSQPNMLVLCVNDFGVPANFPVQFADGGRFTLAERDFPSLSALLRYLQRKPLASKASPENEIRLSGPAFGGQFSPFESDKIDFASQRRSQTKAEQDNPYAETPNVVYADFFDGSNDDDDGCCQDMTSARGVRPSSAEATVFLLGLNAETSSKKTARSTSAASDV